ncbi:MAG: pyrrolo-quinoline quinone, partial [Planctomycetes bacterium]|nr:pyrrolo-quinoline quinone [Planctomycetota bacterium]
EAGPEFKTPLTNELKEICMATPAIADGVIYFRTHHHLIAVEQKKH